MSAPLVVLGRVHDRFHQGGRVPGEGGMSEWEMSPAFNRGIGLQLRGYVIKKVIEETLAERIDQVNDLFTDAVAHGLHPDYVIAVEVHCNRSIDKDRNGFHVMAHHQSKNGITLAEDVLEEIRKVRPCVRSWGVNKASRSKQWIGHPLREYRPLTPRQAWVTQTHCTAILVESCFMTNEDEAEWIQNPNNRMRMGRAIGRGIIRYLQTIGGLS